jgi:hypothetical protein
LAKQQRATAQRTSRLKSKQIAGHNMVESTSDPHHLRDAFYGAVQLYPNWIPSDHEPLVSVDGRRYTISQACNLMIGFSDPMPDNLFGNLMYFLNAGDRDLMEDLAKDRSYAGGARYLLELMHRCTADNQTFEESGRYR